MERHRKRKRTCPPIRVKHSLGAALVFLDQVWAAHSNGFVFVAARTLDGRWIEKGFHVAFGRPALERFIRDHDARTHDLYFCPNAFSRRQRLADFALPTPLAWCDIDDTDPRLFRPQPTILVETSPGRFQGIWQFTTAAKPARAEAVSRYLTDTYHGDRGGWSVTKMLRLPGTLNHKPAYDLPTVTVLHDSGRTISHWPNVRAPPKREAQSGPIDPTRFDPSTVIKKFWNALAPNRRRLMADTSVKSRDRSRIIFMIVAALHDAGASPDEIATVVWHSPYFLSKHGARIGALTKEIHRIVSKVKEHK